MEEVKNEKKNNKKTLIVILVLLLICVGGYFGYKYYQQVQLEKADAQIVEMKNAISEVLASKESRVEINESEADKYSLDAFLQMSDEYRVEWNGELDKVKGGFYTARIYGTTEMGNEVMVKYHLTVYVIDDVKPVINVSTNEFAYQVKDGEEFKPEMVETIVGDVKDSCDGNLKPSFEIITEGVDTKALKDGQSFEVRISATDKAGNTAEVIIKVICSKEAVENPEPERHEHKWSSWTTTKEPTCTANGSRERVCECGEKETQNIAALGHSVKWKVTKEATCTETGNREGKCSRCGNTVNETIKALGHSYKVTEEKKATCDEAGHKTEKCSRCGDTKTTNYNALGHNYGWVTVTEATKTRRGEYHHKCSNCGKVDQKKYKEWVVDQAAWDETIHHPEEYYMRDIWQSYKVWVFCFRDGRPNVEIEHYDGFNPADYAESLEGCYRYYGDLRNRIIGQEKVVTKPAWDEIVHHDEVGHWNEWTENV